MCGAVDSLWLAVVNDGVHTNAVVMRPAIGFEILKDAGSPLILIVMQDPGVVCRVMVVASNCSGSFVKTGIPQDRRPTAVGVVRTEDGSITMSLTRLEPPGEYPLHSSELQY